VTQVMARAMRAVSAPPCGGAAGRPISGCLSSSATWAAVTFGFVGKRWIVQVGRRRCLTSKLDAAFVHGMCAVLATEPGAL
jgi:hypothetical protein